MIVFVGPVVLSIFNVARLRPARRLAYGRPPPAYRNIESRFYSLVTFNSGYHTAHHVKPGCTGLNCPNFTDSDVGGSCGAAVASS